VGRDGELREPDSNREGTEGPEVQRALQGHAVGPGRAVLVVEPGHDQQARLARLVTVRGHRAIGTSSMDGARAFIRAFPVDLVLLAEEVVGDSALAVVAEVLGTRPHARVVIMTAPAHAGFGHASRVLEHIERPFSVDALTRLLGHEGARSSHPPPVPAAE
jgi:ActR/RegA family two-component response regulator